MTRTRHTVRIAVALAFVFAAGLSVAVVAPQRAAQHNAATPAVRLPTIVIRPDAADVQDAALKVDAKHDAAQASL